MKRTKPRKKLKDNTVSQSGKSQEAPPKHDLVVKVTGGSPNYMKGTTSSEARKEKKERFNLSRNKKNQTGSKHDSRYGVNKERSNNNKRIVRGLTKAPSFKRCSQRATCSSTLKDSKFPEYLMLNHGETYDEVNGTSVLKVCPYKYCSLNGHLHSVQYPPLKSFISSRRQSLKTQKSVKMEASKEEFVVMELVEKKEYEHGNGETCEVDIETQISETLSEGAPRSEIDSDDYSDSAEMVRFSEGDHGVELKEYDLEETMVDDSVKEIQQTTCEVDAVTQISETVTEGAPFPETDSDDYSDSVEMVKFSESEHGIEFKESDLEETLVDDYEEEKIQEKANRDGAADESGCFNSEVIGMMKNLEADDAGEDTLKDEAEDCKEECQDRIEVITMMEETAKIPFNRTQKPCNREEPDSTISWTIIKCKKPVAETEDLREFNPREPNYLPVVVDADSEKVDLKHQDMDERKNSEDWMFDYALQRAVTKLSSARKRKVALLVEAFETVQPIIPHGREPAPVLSYGRHLQVCN